MTNRTESVKTSTLALIMGPTIALALAAAPRAFAQQVPTNPPGQPAQVAPGSNAAKTQQAAPSEQHQVQLIFSSWTRYCTKGLTEISSEIRTKEVCFTAADGHLPSGQKMVIALLIEPKAGDTKLLRVTLPLGVALVPGTRIVIDETDTMTAPFEVCLPRNGCMADYKADADLIAKLKTGRTLAIQAFDKGQPINFTLPLADFAKAYDGPPSDPTGLNEQQEGLRNEQQPHFQDRLDTPGSK